MGAEDKEVAEDKKGAEDKKEAEDKVVRAVKAREADLDQEAVKELDLLVGKMDQETAQTLTTGKVRIKSGTIRERGTRLERGRDQRKPRSGSAAKLIRRVTICRSLRSG